MAEYIDKNKLYENIAHLEEVARRKFLDTMSGDVEKELYRAQLSERTGIKHMIIDMPAADVAPIMHGKWLDEDFPEKTATVHGFAICSACGNLSHKAEHGYNILSKYCPNCGAKMDG